MNNQSKTNPDFLTLLRQAEYRATPGRISLLKILWQSQGPLNVAAIEKKLNKNLNRVTIYRALEALVSAGIVRRVDLQHDHAHYELVSGREHHHHLICQNCGVIEDLFDCSLNTAVKKILKQSANFSTIQDHSLEFFGLCRQCA